MFLGVVVRDQSGDRSLSGVDPSQEKQLLFELMCTWAAAAVVADNRTPPLPRLAPGNSR